MTSSNMPNPRTFQKKILDLLNADGARAMNKSEIARALEIPGKERAFMREQLRLLTKSGQLTVGKKGRYHTPNTEKKKSPSKGLLIGKIRIAPQGHGWFMPSLTDEQNLASGINLDDHRRVFVQDRNTWTALDGDIVAVRLQRPSPRGGQGYRGRGNRGRDVEMEVKGKVEQIIERRSGQATGIFNQRGKFSYVTTDDERLPGNIQIDDIKDGLQPKKGQVVAVQITEWERPSDKPRGRVVKILGWPGDAGVDVTEIIHQHGLARDFPEDVLHAARSVPDRVEPEELARREDWRDRPVITIDPATAKDHDDAIHVEKIQNGWRLAVHIADVSHYVKPGTIIDIEARERGNSTYLVDRVLPMLPVELSNGICSLKPGVDRLTKCALMDFDDTGKMTKARFFDAVINVPKKYAYEEAQLILEGKDDKLAPLILESWKLASILRQRRFKNGALDMDMPEVRLILNEKGTPTGYTKEEYNESHQLIEEFMLVANEAVARAEKNAHKPTIYRVHEDPDYDKLHEYAELARAHGYEPGDLTNKKHIQALLDEAKGTMEEHAIKLGLLKSLKRATYKPEPEGHYGLSKGDYAHFTSPIRRYADLIVHRALQSLLENPPKNPDRTPGKKDLIEISEHISNTERTSADAENESRRMKMMEWMDILTRQEKPTTFQAVITEIRSVGLFIECTDILQRGVVKRDDFPPGNWRLEASEGRYSDMRGNELAIGELIQVHPKHVDLVNKRIDFALATNHSQPSPKKKKTNNKRSPQKRSFKRSKNSNKKQPRRSNTSRKRSSNKNRRRR